MRCENIEVRMKVRRAGITLWEIARELDVSEPTLYRWLRADLDPDVLSKINKAIEKLDKSKN
ncbi:MAG: helix-turn-helix domain-containing protein [Kiritimatiellales bacterium]